MQRFSFVYILRLYAGHAPKLEPPSTTSVRCLNVQHISYSSCNSWVTYITENPSASNSLIAFELHYYGKLSLVPSDATAYVHRNRKKLSGLMAKI
ncbi:hypothetical protein RSAG8_06299, partial [Rhizoctonia solani AG-8 WAC10335]